MMPRQRLREPESQIQSLDRALVALELFTPSQPSISLGEAATALGVGKSTVHRLFTTMVARGYLSYNPQNREYRLGLAAIRLGNAALTGLDLRRVAWPYLRRLQEETGESAFLLISDHDSAVVLDLVESAQPLRMSLRPGQPLPLHAGASNKVMLAHMSSERIEAYFARPLFRVTERTHTDPILVRKEMDLIREQGYAYSVGELCPDVAAYAVPILYITDVVGSLAVAGPAGRLQGKVQSVYALQRAARDITRELGSRI